MYSTEKRWRNIFFILFICFVILPGLYIAGLQKPHYYLNLSESEPPGLYRLIPFDDHLKVGDLVIFKVPAQASPYIYGRGWLPAGWLLIKNVGALPGDKVQITGQAITINGHYTGPLFHEDSQGRLLPEEYGLMNIPEGYFLPISTYIPNSFDGRYFGPVPCGTIEGKAILVLKF